jgi:ribosomal protein L20A (L18A)
MTASEKNLLKAFEACWRKHIEELNYQSMGAHQREDSVSIEADEFVSIQEQLYRLYCLVRLLQLLRTSANHKAT